MTLNIQQWLTLVLALAVGVFVFLLQRKGQQLHKAQLELLGKLINDRTAAGSLAVDIAKKQFTKALEEYRKAREKL